MEPTLRRAFNEAFSPALFERYRAALHARVGDTPFRLAETPVFLPRALAGTLERHAREILAQLSEPARIATMRAAVPARLDTPGIDQLPNCAQVDFAIVKRADGGLDARVVELQGFPSLYAFELAQAAAWKEAIDGVVPNARALAPFFDGIAGEAEAVARFRETVVANEDPAHVVLLDLAPAEQKTRPDFVMTKKLLDVDAVCPTELVREGRRLFRTKDGARLPVKRIFHRVVFDELDAKKTPMPFAYTDDLDVSWCPHPNWYWIWSKYSLLHLDHPAVPKTVLLRDVAELPRDLDRWVLKPLFSFAGSGVKVDPTPEDVARIPAAQRDGWLLQQKVEYARELVSTSGHGVAVEVRVMCLRAPGEPALRPVWNLVRLSRGKMHGVDHNKDLDWTGSTVGLIAP